VSGETNGRYTYVCGPCACGCCCAIGVETVNVEGVDCEAAVEAELEDDAVWRERRGISVAPA
jgi:hypothetical protein